jgi:hypothetical protein
VKHNFSGEDVTALERSEYFDEQWYCAEYPDVLSSGIKPAEHFLWIGARLRRNPSVKFDTRFYLALNPDVAADGINPLLHFVRTGEAEGRHPVPGPSLHGRTTTTDRYVHFRIDRTHSISPADDWLIFVAYSPSGRLSDCQRYEISSFKLAGYRIALIVNSDAFSNLVDAGDNDSDIQIVRENIGFDFGAWRHAIELIGGLSQARSVTFTNDSILSSCQADLAHLRRCVADKDAQVVFLTENLEVRPHAQSYFYCLKRGALEADALSILGRLPYYTDKDPLIHEVELYFSDWFRDADHQVGILFPMEDVEINPTIHHWEDLLDAGFPFVKVQLLTANILAFDDQRLLDRLGPDACARLTEHCEGRLRGGAGCAIDRNMPHVLAPPEGGRFNSYGAQQAYNLPPSLNETVFVPLSGVSDSDVEIPRILAVIHGFYPDITGAILAELEALHIPMRILVTTDLTEKVEEIEACLDRLGMAGDVLLCPNRGRDVAPFLIEGGRFAGDAEVILHLHSKKSLHDEIYADWGSFLRRNLIGSREIVLSILNVLQDSNVGLVYSDHFSEVVGLRNWGFDFGAARQLLGRLGISLDADAPLEFPTSTMFWARREALDPLFKAGLRYEDFDEEAGQVDGTLAHAIERSFLFITQSAGYSYTKVTAFDKPSETGSPLLRLSAGDISYALDRPKTFLSGGSTVVTEFHQSVPEVYPVSVAKSRSRRRRLNALLPTMQPEKIYGGITTALRVIGHIADELPDDVDLRVLITSDSLNAASVAELSQRLGRNFTWAMPDDDVEGDIVVGMAEHQHTPVSLRAGEFYVATAWWTADLGFRLIDRQRDLHGRSSRLAYIIQDYEPGFYEWSNTYALSEATYHRKDDTLAIINSEELTNYVLAQHEFAESYCVPFVLHPALAAEIAPMRPDKLILAYGRPSVSRNCFELLCEGLRLWQSRHPAECKDFEIIFAGEEFAAERIDGLLGAKNVGKTSLDEYAKLLNRTAVGVSLMVSPHPSYPPLEMASAGCMTITNGYQGKDLSLRADNVISLASLTPAAVAAALEEALSRVSYEDEKKLRTINTIKSLAPPADFSRIGTWLLGEGDTVHMAS